MPGRPTNEPNNYFAFGFQSAKDSEASTFTYLRHLDGTSFEIDREIGRDREGGDGQEIGLAYLQTVKADGQMVCNARPEVAARLWYAALGADTAVASTAPPGIGSTASGVAHEHTATPTSSIPYLTVEQYYADQVERVPNAQITGLTIEGETGRPLKMTAEFMGGGTVYSPASQQSPTRESRGPFFFPGGSYVLDGDATAKITKFKLAIKRNLDGDIYTTDIHREDVVALNFDSEFEATVKYESATQARYDKTNFGAVGSQILRDLATSAFRGAMNINAGGTTARYMEFGINVLTLDAVRVNKLDPDGKTMYADISGQGIKSGTHQVYAKTVVGSIAAGFG